MRDKKSNIATRTLDRSTFAVDRLVNDLYVNYSISNESLELIRKFVMASEIALNSDEGRIELYSRIGLLLTVINAVKVIVTRRVSFKLPFFNIWVVFSKQRLDDQSYKRVYEVICNFVEKFIGEEDNSGRNFVLTDEAGTEISAFGFDETIEGAEGYNIQLQQLRDDTT